MYTQTVVATENGQSFLGSLCRHFARRVPATLVGHQGVIDFHFGRCRITADTGQLCLHVELADPRQVDLAEQLLSEHLLRVAHDESLRVHWLRHGLRDIRETDRFRAQEDHG